MDQWSVIQSISLEILYKYVPQLVEFIEITKTAINLNNKNMTIIMHCNIERGFGQAIE